MRIVQIEDDFHPSAGYQINVLSKYLAEFGHDVYILSSQMEKVPDFLKDFFGTEDIEQRDNDYSQKYNVKILRLPVHCFIGTRAVFTSECIKTIKRLKPDVLFVHGNDTLTGIRLTFKRNSLGCALIMDSHMLGMASKNRFGKVFHKWYKMMVAPIIKKHGVTVIRTQNDDYVQKELGIPLNLAPWISYGSDVTIFRPDKRKREAFRGTYKIKLDAFVVAYVGKLDEQKKGLFFADCIKEAFAAKKDIVFLIVGNTSGEYGKKVEAELEQSDNRIVRFPTQKYEQLAEFFQASDVVVFPTQCSLSFYDAQACGIPVLSENNNINIDRCGHGNGMNFISENKESFREKLVEMANMNEIEWEEMSNMALDYINKSYNYRDKAREYERYIIDSVEEYSRAQRR